MQIHFPGISQQDLEYSWACLENCKHDQALEFGFAYPYFAPGGGYGAQWWQLDSALALSGYKWLDRPFAERALLNFVESQKEDGRICLWGADTLPERVAGGEIPRQREGVSSLPKLFDVACGVLEGSTDEELAQRVFSMLTKYLNWWEQARLDEKTGLFSSVFEETFIPYLGCAGEYAGVDTNVELFVGMNRTAGLAKRLGKQADADLLLKKAAKLEQAINKFLWNEERGAYFPFDLKNSRRLDTLMASAFYPLRLGIAPEANKQRLLSLLQNPAYFNWNRIPLTSVAQNDPAFCTTTGEYCGNASWSGNVWSLINEMVIRGLLDSGERKLAAELALKTVRAFNRNCSEFLSPFDGTGHGVEKYAWTASQYLSILVEVIFGVRYLAAQKELILAPCLAQELVNERLCLKDIPLGKESALDVEIDGGEVRWSLRSPEILRVSVQK